LNPIQQGKYKVFLKDGGVIKTVQKLGRSYEQWKIENNFESPRVQIVVHH
jgi:type III secretory pathway component EscT